MFLCPVACAPGSFSAGLIGNHVNGYELHFDAVAASAFGTIQLPISLFDEFF
jgi:hypothetical protein